MKIDLLDSNAQKAHFSTMQIDDIYNYLTIEGHLVVIQNGIEYFSEDVAAAELYWYLLNWYRSESIIKKIEFKYATIEYIEPILTFSYYQEKQWKVNSPWMKNNNSIIIDEHILESQVKRIICYLADNLEL